jgi:hypothetical protein
VIQES